MECLLYFQGRSQDSLKTLGILYNILKTTQQSKTAGITRFSTTVCQFFFATVRTPNPYKASGLSNNAKPSIEISVDLSRLGSISIMSKLTSQDQKNISALWITAAVILVSIKIKFGDGGIELYIAFKNFS